MTRQERRANERKARKAELRAQKSGANQPVTLNPTLNSTVTSIPALTSTPAPAPEPPRPHPQTGPRTEEGKAISSRNSLTHGLTSTKIILPGEDESAFDAQLEALVAEYQPASDTESFLVRQMAEQNWFLQRIRRREHALLCDGVEIDDKRLQLCHRYAVSHERSFYKALNTLRKMQKERAVSESGAFVSKKAANSAFDRLLTAVTTMPSSLTRLIPLSNLPPELAEALKNRFPETQMAA